jgi:hypothetical protein
LQFALAFAISVATVLAESASIDWIFCGKAKIDRLGC